MFNFQFSKSIIISFLVILGLLAFQVVEAGTPSGADTFQLITDKVTGGDSTGDGGTGAAGDLNYYYVGQSFNTTFEIVSGGTSAANIWIDYNAATATASGLSTGSYFNTWSGQTINANARGTDLGRIYSTGANIPVSQSTGSGNFGSINWTMVRPSAANYGETTPETLDINVGTIGLTTESNISLSGADLLDDEEDFQIHIWADTKKPYALNPSPADAGTGIAVDENYTFDLRDTKNGEGDNTGVGTGVDTTAPPGFINVDDGGGNVDYTPYDSFSCTGIWGTNYCETTVNPGSPLGIPGDSRNWKYSTAYTVTIGGFQDLASSSQDQLGDANGPNTMDTKVYTFTTEADTVAPRVTSESPTRGSSGNSVSTNIIIDVTDRKTYPNGPSGTGVDASTCRINVSSASFALTTYTQGHANVTASAIDYGYRFTINPATDFGQNETVSVSVYDCEDLASNIMTTDNYTFTTADTDAPYIEDRLPDNDAGIDEDGTVSFHVKDDAGGLGLSDVVVYVNGVYWTNDGGSGTVTTNGTRITYATSSNYNGSNYLGDTSSVSGNSSDYTITIDPENNFLAGEGIPVIIYAQDTSGNIMERDVYTIVVGGGASCSDGSSFCGANTTYTGGQCVGTGGGSGSSGGGGGGSMVIPQIREDTVSVIQIDEDSVLVSWLTNMPGSTRVLYDLSSHDDTHEIYADPPNYDFAYSTQQNEENSLYHAVTIDGLSAGQKYYFKPVSIVQGHELFGTEVQMAPVFATELIEQEVIEERIVIEKQECSADGASQSGDSTFVYDPAACPICEPAAERIVYKEIYKEVPLQVCLLDPEDRTSRGVQGLVLTQFQDETYDTFENKIMQVSTEEQTIRFFGYAEPNTTVTMILY